MTTRADDPLTNFGNVRFVMAKFPPRLPLPPDEFDESLYHNHDEVLGWIAKLSAICTMAELIIFPIASRVIAARIANTGVELHLEAVKKIFPGSKKLFQLGAVNVR